MELMNKNKELGFDSSQKMTKISGVAKAIYTYDSLGFELDKEELEKQMIEMVQKYQYLDCFNIRNKYKGKFTVIDKIYENSNVYVYLCFYPKYPNNMYIEIRIEALEWNIPVNLDPNTNKLVNMEDFEYESDSD